MSELDEARASLLHHAEERGHALYVAESATEYLKASIRAAREAGMSKTEIARLARISRVTIDAWLEGK